MDMAGFKLGILFSLMLTKGAKMFVSHPLFVTCWIYDRFNENVLTDVLKICPNIHICSQPYELPFKSSAFQLCLFLGLVCSIA